MNWNQWHPQENVLSSVKDILQEALIPDSEVQKNVQEKINIIQNMPDFTFYLLYILGNSSYSEDVRSLSGILVKNNLQSTYQILAPESILKIKQECIHLIMDPSREVRISISNVIVIIARDHLKNWPELIPFLLKTFAAQNEYSDICLTTLFKICEDLINNQKSQDEIYRVTKEVFPKFVEYLSKDDCTMHQDIVRLTNQFLQDYFHIMRQSLDLTLYLRNVIRLANTDDIELQKYVCHTFVIYVDKQEDSLLPHLHDVIMYLIEKNQHEDNEVALQACEFWLATTKLSTCKDILSPYIDKLLPTLLKNMRYSASELNIIKDSLGADSNNKDLAKDISPFHMRDKNGQGDDECFSDGDDDTDEQGDDFDDFYMGWTLRKCSAASLDSLAVKFGDDLLPVLIPFISEMLNHSDYLVKESAILALGAIAEGCMNGLKAQLPELISFLQSSMTNEHSVVRVITCWTLSRYVPWIVNVKPDNPHMYFVPIMLLLLKHFVDVNKRVQRAAISAFCIFQEEAQMKLVPYISIILEGFLLGFERFQCRSLYLLYDAIGALSQSVGNHLGEQEYVSKLLPPLMRKFTESDNYYDDHFIAVLECLANVIPALEVSFLPYAEVVFCHCLQLINDTLVSCINYQEHPNEYDPPDKEPMSVAHDVLYSMALGLKTHFVKYVTNSNLLYLLYTTMQDGSNLIRQTSIALYGELVSLCYPFLSSNISEYIPLIVKNLDEHTDGVCNNAAWVLGKLCSVMGTNIQPYIPDIVQHFVHILRDPAIARTMHQTVAISLCTVFFVCPEVTVPDLDVVIKNCCLLIRNVRDSDEKDLAFRGLCEVIIRHPEFNKNNFIYFCDAAASWFNIRVDLKDIIRNVLMSFKLQCGEENWAQFYGQFPDPLKARKCPQHLFAPLIKNIIEEMRKACKKDPLSFGFNSSDNAYEPLKLMQAVMAKTNEICLRYLDNSMLCSLPSPSNSFCETSVHAIRNKRQKMEDRHVAIHDLNTMFNIQEASPSSYYAIFDGHAGHDAAVYSSAHLHQFLAENKYFIGNPEQALLDAFCKTDALFLEKCKVENLSGGTTAVVALLRPKEKTLYIAWVGDSQALLVKEGKILQCVNPHKPCREDERERIEKAGGCVMLWGTWRVNGQLAVSRAIGDVDYKPHVIAVPDVKEVSLDGNEDFLIIACDGLWDYLSEYAAADEVYFLIKENPDDTERISKQLVQRARYEGSTDNISVIVVFLKDPHKIAAEAHRWATKDGPPLNTDNMEAGLDNVNNPFTNSNGTMKNLDVETDNIHLQKSGDGLLLNLTDNFKTNGTNLSQDIFEKSNGTKKSSSDIHFDGDFGPETDVDAVDDAFSPVEKTKSFADSLITGFDEEHLTKSSNNEDVVAFNVGLANNNPLDGNFNPFSNKQAVDEDKEDKKEEQQVEEHGGDNREETPTPPVDAVHDVGGLEENPAESDSEDEWNYIQGDQAKPETLLLQSETVVESSELEDEMSQLNPNAAEFVPVSPTRSIPSPACRALINEQVISQSPKRPLQVDIKVPNEMEFETEVKSRPSDFDALSNGHDSDSEHNVSSGAEQIENILNGKSIDEIPEFRPGSTPSKQLLSEEFHFGPNAAPFTPKLLDQSEAFSTKANFGDDTEQTLNDSELAIPHKDLTDPMSMSFSAERGESNPFQDEDDLNRVHDLPENLDEFLEKTSVGDNKENRILDDTISDLPEHDVLGKVVDNDQAAIQTTDLDKISQDDEKELASPLEPDQDDFLVDDKEIVQSKTPDLLDDFVVVPEKNVTDDSNIASLPELEPISPVKQDGENLQSTLHQELDDDSRLSPSQGHPEFLQEQDRSVSPTVDPLSELSETKSPLPEDTEIIQASSDAPETDLLESKSPLPDPELSHQEKPPLEEDIDFLHSKSPVQSDADILETKSPLPGDAEIPVEQENVQELNLGENLQIPENEGQGGLGSQSPACEFMSGAKSPLCDFEHSKSPVYEQESTNDILVSEPVLKNEVENIDSSLVVKKLSSSPACEYSADPAICDRFQTDARSPFDSQNEQKHEEESTSSVKDDISSPIEAMSPEHVLEETVSEEIHKTTSEPVEETPLVDEQEVSKIEVHGEISSQELLGDLSCTVTSTQSHELLDDKKEYDTHEALEPLDLPKKTELFNGLNNVDSEFNEQISIKTDNIKLEFAEPAVLSPSEDSKIIDEVPVVTTSEAPVQEQKTEETSPIHEQVQEVAKEFPIISTESSVVETVGISQEPSKELPVLEPLPIVPLVSQDTIEVKKEEKKSSTPASAKKITGKPSLSKSSTTSPKTALKASPSPAASHKTGVAPRVLSKTGTTKPSTALKSPASATTASKPSPKPKTTAAPKPIDKKPLTNGEVKPTSKTSLTKKPEVAATKTTTRPTTATTKTSPTKPIAPRPTATSKTVPPKGTATLKPTSSTTSAPKPRVPLSSRTTSNSTANKLTTAPNSKSTTQPTSRPATATGSAKPKTITSAPSKPRVPLTKTITKSADVEKEKKESANKLTASHTSTVNKSTSNRTSTTAIKKTETKPISQRTAISKTSTTTTRTNTITKKPTEVKSVTKTKTTKIEKPKENGVAPTSITEEIKEMTTVNNVVNNTETLVKDNSPLDNKLISETTNNLIDVNPAD